MACFWYGIVKIKVIFPARKDISYIQTNWKVKASRQFKALKCNTRNANELLVTTDQSVRRGY